ncbi:hypothetical protein BH09MYX1_BH09MYX1_11210 [soil metagenome]
MSPNVPCSPRSWLARRKKYAARSPVAFAGKSIETQSKYSSPKSVEMRLPPKNGGFPTTPSINAAPFTVPP